jgi:5-methylcytosine-specific restriction endonuclease McrA
MHDQDTTPSPTTLKLTVELVPRPAWGRSLAKLLPRQEWDRIRKEVYERNNRRCTICGNGGRITCHEIWDYDDVNHTQRLVGFSALCGSCHLIKQTRPASAGIVTGPSRQTGVQVWPSQRSVCPAR